MTCVHGAVKHSRVGGNNRHVMGVRGIGSGQFCFGELLHMLAG